MVREKKTDAAPRKWAKEIAALRKQMGLNQSQFADKLRVTQATVSDWENGKHEPQIESYIELANNAEDKSAREFFLDQVPGIVGRGLRHGRGMLQPAVRVDVVPATGTLDGQRLRKAPDAVAITLLRDSAAAGEPREIERAEIEDTLVMPYRMCPHPEHTVCIRVVGDSMSPVLEDGYIVAVDLLQQELRALYGKMVAARSPSGGVTIKWFVKAGEDRILMPQNIEKHQPLKINKEPGWKILGRVLWWIGEPQK